MTKRMLIDATHPEETRVAICEDGRLIDFDIEIASRRQLKGNIYLAKVVRVEPSLQAAFVDYGGNRHGFLPFSEIHPDYYQIPQADREELERLERELEARANAESQAEENANGTTVTQDAEEETADVLEEIRRRRARILRSYRIQEVIRRRQIMLVQVVKEERGTKGAALTTYISLPGRYCVLMPNTPKGGGISRKIADPAERRRLKKIAEELGVPEGMGLIIRTAGQERTKAVIRRDYEYLVRLWNDIRQKVLSSIAPCLIYEESDLVTRALRDLYTRDIEEILIEGEEAWRRAREVMKIMSPSRVRLVKQYTGEVPLFARYGIEDQLDAMMSPVVQLPSGGSIVIHATEALTAIDVNSGKSTRERHIDETALKTNLEAAEEIARQLRLRDIAGLVVVDFIDMNDPRHQRQVERRLREALKADRARIQMGRISSFGLLELSRQRLRPSILELSTQICPHCAGTGLVRSTESLALHVLRRIQDEGLKGEAATLAVRVPTDVALYLLNRKRDVLSGLEKRYGMEVRIEVEEHSGPEPFTIEIVARREAPRAEISATAAETRPAGEPAAAGTAEAETAEAKAGRRRRRRRRRRRGEQAEAAEAATPEAGAVTPAEAAAEAAEAPEDGTEAAAAQEPEPVAEGVGPQAVAAEEDATEGAVAEPQAAEAPRRRRRRRRRRGEKAEAAEPVAEAAGPETAGGPLAAGEAGSVGEATPAAGGTVMVAGIALRAPGFEVVDAVALESPAAAARREDAAVPADGEAAAAPATVAEEPAEAVAVRPETPVPAEAERPAVMASASSGEERREAGAEGERPDGEAEGAPRRTGWWSRWLGS
uniref:Ribonuclease E n=1 Tax=uncultured Alphaproteobacteria bacterium TaxID=91750 RepID=H5SK13_9PROT|nr:hypothetical conserved protein [uncultured Alphaproteobacteria bacterium]